MDAALHDLRQMSLTIVLSHHCITVRNDYDFSKMRAVYIISDLKMSSKAHISSISLIRMFDKKDHFGNTRASRFRCRVIERLWEN